MTNNCKILLVVLILFGGFVNSTYAQSVEKVVEKATVLYRDEKYEKFI
ncbi:hypothetical protein EZS27_015721 [termite gut metagenome]|jgi:hypothetical protein|uniref:Uncharacterized protein n=1 Tax=termite gut metagenome TaxID=433724 RepID=A0A5J4RQZ5_9ZZZZ